MRGRREPRGPRVISRYDPNAEVKKVHMSGGREEEYITVPVRGGSHGVEYWLSIPPPSREQLTAQQDEPVKITWRYWLHHDYWVDMADAGTYREDDVRLLIKRAVLREERELARARQEVDALARFGDLPTASREVIPDGVRMFVWQRDGGACVRCGGREKLEFDHIIPVADGGSSTERNVQLLCEPCNRNKGRSVS